jgi:hypothetical protein
MAETIDYSQHFPGALIAQGRGRDFLVITKLDRPTRARLDRKPARYEVLYRWLSRECTRDTDEAYVCVRGSEVQYWQRRELGETFFMQLKAGSLDLFSVFRLFP